MFMKKGFTLLEMLVVIAILAVLMGIIFRLSSIGSDSEARTKTIMRLQCLENCLSGYYAAFGSYPPVKRHTVPDPFLEVTDFGVQTGEANYVLDEKQAHEACLSQPVACNFPYDGDEDSDPMRELSQAIQDRYQDGDYDDMDPELDKETEVPLIEAGFDNGSSTGVGRFDPYKNETSWNKLRLFRFGLMSYLLPRYLVMLKGSDKFFEFAQWDSNNAAVHSPFTGGLMAWSTMKQDLEDGPGTYNYAQLANIPSQSICARWMPNLKGQCVTNGKVVLFGVNISETSTSLNSQNPRAVLALLNTPKPDSDKKEDMYILDGISIADGWGNEFFYYSPSPHQKYTLWSAGANGKTFPPWISKESLQNLGAGNLKKIADWIQDDIINMSN